MNWRNIVIGILARWGMEMVAAIAQAAWNKLWDEVVEAIGKAEFHWREHGMGGFKKEYVLTVAMDYLEKKKVLTWWNRGMIRNAIGQVIDYLIQEINSTVSRDWASKARELQTILAGKLPVIV